MPTLVYLSCHLLSQAAILENNIKILADKKNNNNKAQREAEKHRLGEDEPHKVTFLKGVGKKHGAPAVISLPFKMQKANQRVSIF